MANKMHRFFLQFRRRSDKTFLGQTDGNSYGMNSKYMQPPMNRKMHSTGQDADVHRAQRVAFRDCTMPQALCAWFNMA
jgi:hypothetical protein